MPLDLAALENSIPDDPEPEAEAPEPEAEPEPAAEETEPEDSEGDETKLTSELSETAKFKIGDEELTGAEIKAGLLRQADYTRKTQALAEEKRALRSELEAKSEENIEFREFVASLKDPKTLRLELLRYYPDTYDALREEIVRERLEEQDLAEPERKIRRRLERAEAAEYARSKDDEYRAKKTEATETVQRTAKLRETFDSWLDGTLASSGLDPASEEHQSLVRNEIAARYRGVKWEKGHFEAAAAKVAKALGKTPGADPEKAKAAAKLPPVRTTGAKPPAEKRAGKPKPKVETGDFFTNLRRSNGLR